MPWIKDSIVIMKLYWFWINNLFSLHLYYIFYLKEAFLDIYVKINSHAAQITEHFLCEAKLRNDYLEPQFIFNLFTKFAVFCWINLSLLITLLVLFFELKHGIKSHEKEKCFSLLSRVITQQNIVSIKKSSTNIC